MILIPATVLREIERAAETAAPEECCGLLVGRDFQGKAIRVSRRVASRNLAAERKLAFEIEPQVWLDLKRALSRGDERIVGLYHSHPEGPAAPSARDRDAAWELDPGQAMAWLIVSARYGGAAESRAHLFADGAFLEVPVQVLA